MKYYQVIHKIRHPQDSYSFRKIINPFIEVDWFHTFECKYTLLDINYLIKDLPPKYRIPRKTLNNSDYNHMNNVGWCPLYWYIDLDVCKTNYGHTLYCEDLLKRKNVDDYAALKAFKRNNYIDTLLDGLIIEGQE